MIKLTDIAWLAGLLEGEGCFYLDKGRYPNIKLQMTCEDIVVRAATLMKSKVRHYGNTWITHAYGAYAIQWMMTLYPYLGKHRRSKIIKVIKVWKENIYCFQRGMSLIAACHPNKPFYALGLCKYCYDKKRYEKKQSLKRSA
ncbi:MAG TPA: hypothetical protein ENI23_08035 [bacterium]|nr:hypothetical protein [bacterium]